MCAGNQFTVSAITFCINNLLMLLHYVSEDSSLGKYLPAFQRILVTSLSGSSSTREGAAALVLPDPDHDIIKII